MSEKLLVVFVAKSMLKRQSVKVTRKLVSVPFKVILIVINIFTNSVPTDAFFVFDFIREIQELHAIII